MKSIIIFVSLCFTWNTNASCPTFTEEQYSYLYSAYNYGMENSKDWEYALAAIVWQESFISGYVIKTNTLAGSRSFGITHIEVSTAKYLEGVDSEYYARAKIIPRLMMDDEYAYNLAVAKLEDVKHSDTTKTFTNYNGNVKGNTYGSKIVEKINILKTCNVFSE